MGENDKKSEKGEKMDRLIARSFLSVTYIIILRFPVFHMLESGGGVERRHPQTKWASCNAG